MDSSLNKCHFFGVGHPLTNSSNESSYCNSPSGYGCRSKDVGTFTLKPMHLTEGFRHLRWRLKTLYNDDGRYAFSTSGIDVYGTLVIVPRIKKCTFYCRCASHPRIVAVVLGSWMNK